MIGINPMSWRGLGCIRLAIDCFDGHAPHQRAHVAAAHLDTLLAEHVTQHAAAGERIVYVQLVDAPHQHQVRVRDRARMVIDRRATDLQFFGLFANR